jgi:hypothetical protein
MLRRSYGLGEAVGVTGEAVRWRRYGNDRLYATAADGTKLGYRDLITGEDHIDDPTRTAEFTSIVGSWPATGRGESPAVLDGAAIPAEVTVVPEQREPTPIAAGAVPLDEASASQPESVGSDDCEDLAGRVAGALAREQALALKQAAPVRTFVARVFGVQTEERAWRIGADGEEKVAAQLAKLARKDPRWRYLHAIPIGENGADIDHFVVGPGGVFSLNAKHHPGSKVWVGGNTLMINGQRQPYIRNSRFEAQRAARLLTAACGFPVPVTGMVVPVGADDITIKSPPDDVHIVNRMRLVGWLRARPAIFTDEQIDAIFEAARKTSTWQPRH